MPRPPRQDAAPPPPGVEPRLASSSIKVVSKKILLVAALIGTCMIFDKPTETRGILRQSARFGRQPPLGRSALLLHAKRNGILMLGEIDLGDHPRCDSNRFQRYRFRCGRGLGRFAGKGRARVEDFYGFTRMRRHVQRAGRIARLQERTGARIAQHVLKQPRAQRSTWWYLQ